MFTFKSARSFLAVFFNDKSTNYEICSTPLTSPSDWTRQVIDSIKYCVPHAISKIWAFDRSHIINNCKKWIKIRIHPLSCMLVIQFSSLFFCFLWCPCRTYSLFSFRSVLDLVIVNHEDHYYVYIYSHIYMCVFFFSLVCCVFSLLIFDLVCSCVVLVAVSLVFNKHWTFHLRLFTAQTSTNRNINI